MATEEKYPVLNRDNITLLVQMQLSEKQKRLSQFFAAIFKFICNFKCFEKKDDHHSFGISKNVVR